MHLNSGTWGHVGLYTPPTLAMESAEEAGEMAMLRCRYGRKSGMGIRTSLMGFLPNTGEIIFNPNTLQDLANIFETNIERVFA